MPLHSPCCPVWTAPQPPISLYLPASSRTQPALATAASPPRAPDAQRVAVPSSWSSKNQQTPFLHELRQICPSACAQSIRLLICQSLASFQIYDAAAPRIVYSLCPLPQLLVYSAPVLSYPSVPLITRLNDQPFASESSMPSWSFVQQHQLSSGPWLAFVLWTLRSVLLLLILFVSITQLYEFSQHLLS